MSTQLRGRRSGPFWSLLFFVTVAALAVGYVLGAQRAGILSMAQSSPVATVALLLMTAVETPTIAVTLTPDASAVQTVVAAQLATALAATLTAQPTPDQDATATTVAAALSTAVAATLTAPQRTLPAPTATSEIQATPFGNCLGTVRVEGANLYQGPSATYPKVGKVQRGESLMLMEHTNGNMWFKVGPTNSAGDQGWILGYLINIPSSCR